MAPLLAGESTDLQVAHNRDIAGTVTTLREGAIADMVERVSAY